MTQPSRHIDPSTHPEKRDIRAGDPPTAVPPVMLRKRTDPRQDDVDHIWRIRSVLRGYHPISRRDDFAVRFGGYGGPLRRRGRRGVRGLVDSQNCGT